MVTQGTAGDINVRIQLDEGSIPDFGGPPPGPPGIALGRPPVRPPFAPKENIQPLIDEIEKQLGIDAPPVLGPSDGAMPPEILRMFAEQAAVEGGAGQITPEQREQLKVLKQSMAIQSEAREYQRNFTEEGDERKSTFQNISAGIKESGAFQKIAATSAGQGAAKLLGGIGKLGGPLGIVAGATAGMLLNTKVMKAGIGGLTSIIQAFFDVLMAPLMPLIARGLTAMAKLIPWLQKFMNDPFGELGKLLEIAFNWMMDLPVKILEQWITIPEDWLIMWEGVKESWLEYFSGILGAWGSLWDGVVALWLGDWDGALEGFLGFFTGIAGSWLDLFTGILGSWLDLFINIAPDWMKPWLTTAKDWLENFDETSQDWLDLFPTVAKDFIKKFANTPSEFLKNWNETPDKWLTFWTDQPKFWTALWEDIPQEWKDLFKFIPGLWLGGWEGTPADWSKLWSDISAVWIALWTWTPGQWMDLFKNIDWMEEILKALGLGTTEDKPSQDEWSKILFGEFDWNLMWKQLQLSEITEQWGIDLQHNMDRFNAEIEGFGKIGAAVWDGIYGVAKSAWDWIIYYFQSALDNMWILGGLVDTPTKPESIADAIAKGWQGVTAATSEMETNIKVIIETHEESEEIRLKARNKARLLENFDVVMIANIHP